MKKPYSLRGYRTQSSFPDEKSFQLILEESDIWVTCLHSTPENLPEMMLAELGSLRKQLKAWSRIQPEFLTSLVPLKVDARAPEIVQQMATAAERFQVGPMAAVAGAIAGLLAEKFLPYSCELLLENGGDIFMHSTRERTIALLPDPESGGQIGLSLQPELFPVSVCSSSATIGHALSFGQGDLATVIAKNGAVADAAATAFCNRLQKAGDVQKVLSLAESMPEILGIFVQCKGQIGLQGAVNLATL